MESGSEDRVALNGGNDNFHKQKTNNKCVCLPGGGKNSAPHVQSDPVRPGWPIGGWDVRGFAQCKVRHIVGRVSGGVEVGGNGEWTRSA